MKKLLISLALLFGIVTGFMNAANAETIEVLPTMQTQSTAPNRIWVGTFQVVWNEAIDNVVHKPIKFADYDSIIAKQLNKKEFKKTNISENAYYTKTGIVSPDLKSEIEKGIKAKFNETSDILDVFDWTEEKDKYLFYTMLRRDFEFENEFTILEKNKFGNEENV